MRPRAGTALPVRAASGRFSGLRSFSLGLQPQAALLLLIAALLVGCAGNPLAPAATAGPTATAAPTLTPLPLPPTALPTVTATVAPTASPTVEATATPAPPTMQSFLDPTGSLRLRLPADWIIEAGDGEGAVVRARSPADGALAYVEASRPLDPEAVADAFLVGAIVIESATLDDGTRRVTALDAQGRHVEYRFQPRGGLLMVAALAQAEPLDAATVAAFWEGLRLYPSRAAATFDPPAALPPLAAEAIEATVGGTSEQGDGALIVLGEVANRGEADAESVRVTVELLSADGRVVASAEGPAERDLLLAGERSPFLLTVAPPEEAWVGARARAEALPAAFLLESAAPWLSVAPLGGVEGATVRTVVSNEGSVPARFVRVVAAAYDEEGVVVAVGSAYAGDAPLDPGTSRHVTVALAPLSVEPEAVARVELWVDGKR